MPVLILSGGNANIVKGKAPKSSRLIEALKDFNLVKPILYASNTYYGFVEQK